MLKVVVVDVRIEGQVDDGGIAVEEVHYKATNIRSYVDFLGTIRKVLVI